MYGFIYLWYDRKHKRYYLGKHWVKKENDNYVCSSRWMNRAYKRRPRDFKKRILEYVYDRNSLREREYQWGLLIKEEELGKRYYNLRLPGLKQWHDHPEQRKTVGEKLSVHMKERWEDPEYRRKATNSRIGKGTGPRKTKGRKLTPEWIRASSEGHRGQKRSEKTKETMRKAWLVRKQKSKNGHNFISPKKKLIAIPCPTCGKMLKKIGLHKKVCL